MGTAIEKNQSNYLKTFYVSLTCIFLGVCIGAITNILNGIISPRYFSIVMGWDFFNIIRAIIAQGIFEGLIYGVIFSIIFTTGFCLITKNKATYNFAFRQLIKITLFVLSCWTIGGILAVLLSLLSPEFYKSHFYAVPTEKIEMVKYAWVGGSIYGGMIGGFFGAIFGVVLIKDNWKYKAE